MKARILVAEDDPDIRHGLAATLESEGYDVTCASDGAQALALYPQSRYDLVLLDVMMPRASGYDVCRTLRETDPRVPILFLTAKGEETDKVIGLKLGADDYLAKPFGIRELLARVEAALRRARVASSSASASTESPDHFHLGPARIDCHRFTATINHRESSLTAREMKLALVFHRHPGHVLTRDELLNAVWGVGYFGTTRTLDQHVAQLRKKIEPDPEHPRTLITVHAVGYRCDSSPSA